jgi:hypothetical protein
MSTVRNQVNTCFAKPNARLHAYDGLRLEVLVFFPTARDHLICISADC